MPETNLLCYGDNLEVLRRHVKDETVDQRVPSHPSRSTRRAVPRGPLQGNPKRHADSRSWLALKGALEERLKKVVQALAADRLVGFERANRGNTAGESSLERDRWCKRR